MGTRRKLHLARWYEFGDYFDVVLEKRSGLRVARKQYFLGLPCRSREDALDDCSRHGTKMVGISIEELPRRVKLLD